MRAALWQVFLGVRLGFRVRVRLGVQVSGHRLVAAEEVRVRLEAMFRVWLWQVYLRVGAWVGLGQYFEHRLVAAEEVVVQHHHADFRGPAIPAVLFGLASKNKNKKTQEAG